MHEPVVLWVVGNGKMAKALIDQTQRPEGVDQVMLAQGDFLPDFEKTGGESEVRNIAVHVGSGRKFLDLFNCCNQYRIPLIQASSSLKEGAHKDAKPIILPNMEQIRFPFIKAPNLALPVLALKSVLQELGRKMQMIGAETFVAESHQAEKKSAPITAQLMLADFGGKPEEVSSERDEVRQMLVWGVPHQHLGGHAIHKLLSEACGVEVTIGTRIYGRRAYVEGLGMLVRKIIEKTPGPGVYDAGSVIFD